MVVSDAAERLRRLSRSWCAFAPCMRRAEAASNHRVSSALRRSRWRPSVLTGTLSRHAVAEFSGHGNWRRYKS
jgi:hypothetical protein